MENAKTSKNSPNDGTDTTAHIIIEIIDRVIERLGKCELEISKSGPLRGGEHVVGNIRLVDNDDNSTNTKTTVS